MIFLTYRLPIIVWISLMLVACGPLVEIGGGGDAPRLFRMNSNKQLVGSGGRRDVTVFVEQPTVPGSLRSDHIAVRSGDHEIKYLPGVRWSDRTSKLVARYVVESLEDLGLVGVIGIESLDLPSDFRLKLDIREFAAIAEDGDGASIAEVEVRLAATIIHSTPLSIVATRTFSGTVRPLTDDPAEVVKAFNEALDQTMLEMTAWLLATIDAAN